MKTEMEKAWVTKKYVKIAEFAAKKHLICGLVIKKCYLKKHKTNISFFLNFKNRILNLTEDVKRILEKLFFFFPSFYEK